MSLLSPAPSHQELHQVAASWGCEAAVAAFVTSRLDRRNSLLHGAAPEYLRDCCNGTHSSASGLRLRSLERTDLRVRRMKTHFGDRAFSAAGPRCWNSLPDWLQSYLCDRRQTFLYDGVLSTVRSLCCGVPQGSVLGLLLFLLYTADLGEIAASLGLSSHFYADHSQLYTWGPPSTVPQQRRRMELGVERIAEWMRSNRLRLNPEKMDFLWCATRRRCIHLDTGELSVCGALIRCATSASCWSMTCPMSMRRHVAWMVGCCFRKVRLIRSCIKSLPLGCKGGCRAFVTSRVDRCNSLH